MVSTEKGVINYTITTGPTMSNIVLMGVSGSGKSLIGSRLAKKLNYQWVDGDHLHTDEHIALMRSGIPLNDEQRQGWLRSLARILAEHDHTVVACSALRQQYRETLLRSCNACHLVWLHTERSVLEARLHNRSNHFFPPQLLSSQLETLEPPDDAIAVDTDRPPEQIVKTILDQLADSVEPSTTSLA